VLSFSINPDWPWWITVSLIFACAYAWFVVWRVNHPRYRRYWHSNVWLFVAGGNTMIAATAGFILGPAAFLGIMALNAVWGLPMVVAVVLTNERKQAAEDEQADAVR
jgi:hypothetical protein